MSEIYTWKILQDGLSLDEMEDIKDWSVYSGSTPYSGGETSDLSLTGLTFRKNGNRCHNVIYSITWNDDSGNIAVGVAIMSACTIPLKCYDIVSAEHRFRVPCKSMDAVLHLSAVEKPCFDDETLETLPTNDNVEEYEYSIRVNGKMPDSEGDFSGNCSGETEIFRAWCLNEQNFDRFGTWTVYSINPSTHEYEYVEYTTDVNNGRFEYTFIENTSNKDVTYKIVFMSECGETAKTIYTVVASEDCIPCETINGVDFQLSSETLWAEVNLDACRTYSIGNYYSWADYNGFDSSEASAFTLSSYTYYDSESQDYIMYNDQDGLRIMNDFIYSDEWTVPTPYHFQELMRETTISSDSSKFIFSKQFEGEERPREIVIPKVGGYLHNGHKTSTGMPYFWTSCISSDTIASAITCSLSGNSNNTSLVCKTMPRYFGLQLRLIKEKKNDISFALNGQLSEDSTNTRVIVFNMTINGSEVSMAFEIQLEPLIQKIIGIGKIYEPFSINYVEKIIDDKGDTIVNDGTHSKIQLTFREGNTFSYNQYITITIN